MPADAILRKVSQSEQVNGPAETQLESNYVSMLRLDAQDTISSAKGQRIPALDFTKGALVLIMVFYHWINYFIGPQWKYYPYLRFLTPSFIFITGFMISHVYLSKYATYDSRLWRRLFTRGWKLLAIFLVLNLACNLFIPILGTGIGAQSVPTLANLFTIFVSGNLPIAGDKLASFSILVPISYLLMLSGMLILPLRRYKYTFHIACAFLLSSIGSLRVFGVGSYNLEFVAIGMIGVLFGFLSVDRVNDALRHYYVLIPVYLGYVIAITIWNVPFLLLVLGVLLNLMILYAVGHAGSKTGVIKDEIILLGKYSLFGYLSQIAILQVLNAGFHRVNLGLAAMPVSFVVALTLTIASTRAVDYARAKVARADRLYKAIFA